MQSIDNRICHRTMSSWRYRTNALRNMNRFQSPNQEIKREKNTFCANFMWILCKFTFLWQQKSLHHSIDFPMLLSVHTSYNKNGRKIQIIKSAINTENKLKIILCFARLCGIISHIASARMSQTNSLFFLLLFSSIAFFLFSFKWILVCDWWCTSTLCVCRL